MDTYITLLYLTQKQEQAVKKLFLQNGWKYLKADLSKLTDILGPSPPVKHVQSSPKNKTGQHFTQQNSTALPSIALGLTGTDTGVEHLDGSFVSEETAQAYANMAGDGDCVYATGTTSVAEERVNKRKSGRNSEVQMCGKKSNARLDSAVTQNSSKRRKTSGSQGIKNEMASSSDASLGVTCSSAITSDEGREADPRNSSRKLMDISACKPKTTQASQVKRELLVCDVCGKQFARSDSLSTHKKRIHGLDNKINQANRGNVKSKKHICEKCGKGYMSHCSLDEHMKTKHSQKVDLKCKCTYCQLTFVRNRFLEQHVNKVHLNVQPYKCDFCDKRFYSQYYRDQHAKSGACQGDNVAKFKCFNCNQGFYSQKSLEIHMVAKHFGGAYVCVCGKTIKWEGDIPRHKSLCKTYKENIATCRNGEARKRVNDTEVEVYSSDASVKHLSAEKLSSNSCKP